MVPRAGVEPATYRLGAPMAHQSAQTGSTRLNDLAVLSRASFGTVAAVSVPRD